MVLARDGETQLVVQPDEKNLALLRLGPARARLGRRLPRSALRGARQPHRALGRPAARHRRGALEVARAAALPAPGHDGLGRHRGRRAEPEALVLPARPCATPRTERPGCSWSEGGRTERQPRELGLRGDGRGRGARGARARARRWCPPAPVRARAARAGRAGSLGSPAMPFEWFVALRLPARGPRQTVLDPRRRRGRRGGHRLPLRADQRPADEPDRRRRWARRRTSSCARARRPRPLRARRSGRGGHARVEKAPAAAALHRPVAAGARRHRRRARRRRHHAHGRPARRSPAAATPQVGRAARRRAGELRPHHRRPPAR